MKLRSLAVLGWVLLPIAVSPAHAQQIRVLKIGHQFPGGTVEEGDFRDRLCRRFAAEVERRTNGALRFEIFPSNKLVKPEGQLDALRSGAMDLCLMPLNNAFDKLPELNVTLLPGVIKSYEQAFRWKSEPIGRDVTALLEQNGAVTLTWIWQAAGVVAAIRPVLVPDDVRDLRIRGAGKGVDTVLSVVGGKAASMPSSEIPKAFREGKLDAAITSSTSLVAFKLQDFCRAVTTPRLHALFYFQEPLLMSKATFDSLTPDQKKIVTEVGASLEKFALDCARADDEVLARTYLAANALVADMDEDQWIMWQRVSRAAAWRDYERMVPKGDEWLKKALAVP
jgi:TRAP-type C4-dicarboxylate transport system substrate-binding protein